ncbi:C40 family peptidase [Sulfurovum sp.]|uniref:C40 family peptidase n=1 Tax=Sulfurovum sp. TaxID=1969726 RepID=UPI0025CBB8E1|nr:C40 family peptidase [Sulfurovum sp.]
MKKILSVSILLFSISHANLFTVTDRSGKVVEAKMLKHRENDCLNQKETEYSLQAIYDELHREENLARRAEAARARAKRIAREMVAAKKAGKAYHMSAADRQKLLEDAKYFKGGKYVWGGTSPKGFDCSGYVQYLYRKHHVNLPRTAWAQSKKGEPVDMAHLQKGDLLFFLTDKKRGIPVTHVGIYLGNGKFIHAASRKKGIIISPIDHGYYAQKFVSARRVVNPHG